LQGILLSAWKFSFSSLAYWPPIHGIGIGMVNGHFGGMHFPFSFVDGFV
jgi:hypothetical protein